MGKYGNVAVYRPKDRVIQLAGGSSISAVGNPGAAGSVGNMFDFFRQMAQDRDNAELLIKYGHPKEAVDKMSSAQKATSLANYEADFIKNMGAERDLKGSGDAIKALGNLLGEGKRANRPFVGFEEQEQAVKEGRPVPQGVEQRGLVPFQFQGTPKMDKGVAELTRLLKPDSYIQEGNVDQEGNLTSQDLAEITKHTETIPGRPPRPIPGSAPIQHGTVGDPTARYKGQSEIFRDAVSQLTDLQAGRADPSTIVSKWQAEGIALDKALSTTAKNEHTQIKDVVLDSGKIGSVLVNKNDPDDTAVITKTNKFGKKIPITPAPSRRLVTTNDLAKTPVNDVLKTSMSAITKIDDTLDLYYQVERLFTPEVLETMGAIKQLGLKVYDRSGILGAIPKKLRPQFERTLNLIQSANEVFAREKFLLTGQAASAIENDFLRTIFLDPENQGPFNFKTAFERGIGKLERRRGRHSTRVKFIEDARKAGTTVSLTGILTENFNEMQKARNEDLPGATPPGGSGRKQLKTQMNKAKGGK